MHAAVHGKAMVAGFQDKAGARNGTRRTHKSDFHRLDIL
jgi:hypothetical protein